MVKVKIYPDGLVGWHHDKNKFFYCMIHSDKIYRFYDNFGVPMDCNNKEQYYRLLKLRLLW